MNLELDLAGDTEESRLNLLAHEEAKNWTDTALCIQWVWPKSDWRAHKEWWDKLPRYEQNALLAAWNYEHGLLPQYRRTYQQYEADLRCAMKHNEELAQHWAKDIRAAAKRGETIPIKALPRYQHILDRACEIAGVLIVKA